MRLFLLSLLALASCGPPEPDQVTRGQALYETYCLACHEIEGTIGPRLTKEVLASRVTAAALFRYNRLFMPYGAGNSLPEQTYWDITAYLLHAHGWMDDGAVLNEQTADTLRLNP